MPSHPRLLSLSTAVPDHVLVQDDVKAWAARHFDGRNKDIERLMPAFDNAGIETRYSCLPLKWHKNGHHWRDKNRLYVDNAVELLTRAATECLEKAGLGPQSVDAVVAVSTSGFATPSLDALIMQRLGLRQNVVRLPAAAPRKDTFGPSGPKGPAVSEHGDSADTRSAPAGTATL